MNITYTDPALLAATVNRQNAETALVLAEIISTLDGYDVPDLKAFLFERIQDLTKPTVAV